jgi:hypothetical protein
MKKTLLAIDLGADYTMKLERLADIMFCDQPAKFASLLVARSIDDLEIEIEKWMFARSGYDYILRSRGYQVEIDSDLGASECSDFDDGIPF